MVWGGVAQTDGVGESIVYVSEPQPLAHSSEEIIDMVENPVTSDVQVYMYMYNVHALICVEVRMYSEEEKERSRNPQLCLANLACKPLGLKKSGSLQALQPQCLQPQWPCM